ncbi:MAG TPA: TIGR02996 domain-containing protein, partial [Myxococcus sp.]|nr:TIGR02996 domain-containing protein [Myxococcus sp.]
MSDTVTGLLGRAMEAFERHEHEEVLQLLLEAWGQTRSERLAGLAERLSAMAIPGAIPPEGPLGLLRRLAALVEKAGTGDSWGVGSGLGECQARPPDPRLTPALLDLAALPVADKAEVCLRLCNLLGHVGDPRSLGPLRALHAGLLPGSRLERRLGAVIERVAGQPVMALEAESSSLCDVLEEAIARRAESMARSRSIREALHARILEHPDDDGARLVLADHLQEVGDPLGELIALQCAPQPDADRIAEVLQQHRPTWEALLGPGVMPGETRFVRGFPHAVRMKVEPGQRLPPPGPFWCTMREIDWCWTGDEEEADWLAHPHLGGVTVLWQVSHAMARRLGQHRLPVRRLELCINVRREPREV